MVTQVIDPYRKRRTTDIQRAEIENLKSRMRSVERRRVSSGGGGVSGVMLNIPDGYITTDMLGNLAVTAAKIANATITSTQIDAATITGSNIAALTIEAANIANATITGTQIANLTVTAAQIADATITATQIADLTITAAEIANSTITGGKIAASTITGGNLVDQTIQAGKIENLTITAAQIANLTITGGAAGKIAASTITEDNIVANTITAASIAALTITAAQIAAATITADKLVANTITASQITTDWLTTLKFKVGGDAVTLDSSGIIVNNTDGTNLVTWQWSASAVGNIRGVADGLGVYCTAGDLQLQGATDVNIVATAGSIKLMDDVVMSSGYVTIQESAATRLWCSGSWDSYTLAIRSNGTGDAFWVRNSGDTATVCYITKEGQGFSDIGWSTFSPAIPNTLNDVLAKIQGEIGKPHAPLNKQGTKICDVCGDPFPCSIPSHRKPYEKKYGKSASSTALWAGKAVLLLQEENRKLIERVEKLENKIK